MSRKSATAKQPRMKLTLTEAEAARSAIVAASMGMGKHVPGREHGSTAWALDLLAQAMLAYNMGIATYVSPDDLRLATEMFTEKGTKK